MSDGWTQTPNIVLEAVPDMSEAEVKLTMTLVRLTFGFHKNEVRMTYDDMTAATGLSKPAISAAIDRIEERGFFKRGRRSMWLVNSKKFLPKHAEKGKESLLNETENSKESLLNGDANSKDSLPYESKKSLPSSIKEKKEEKRKGDTPPPVDMDFAEMVNALVDVTGLDGHRFWVELSTEAQALRDGGYTAVEVLNFYTSPPLDVTRENATAWNWYIHDWRGRKSDRPKLKDIWETISGARKGVPAVTKNGRASPAPAERSEAMNIPHTGTGW